MNEVMQTCEMDLHLHYWDVNENLVGSRYYGSSFLGHATHTDLLNHFQDTTKELPLTNLFQISMDGLNVNFKFSKSSLQTLIVTVHTHLLTWGPAILIWFTEA